MRTLIQGFNAGGMIGQTHAGAISQADNTRTTPAAGADALVQEADGTSKFTLEDASGSVLLEA